ncbi:hypothetical protein MOMUL_30970 [Moorella mulderi DSM 14980]|uniref:Uncharacterized protein n=1 Tax=Moorella mulderi DSM 14980 TaxID=1122241 RepID=A0A151AL14_9FIRM|nr:hypothetical protein MOMUL_30970 [Moorella mulderi DSM 14980]
MHYFIGLRTDSVQQHLYLIRRSAGLLGQLADLLRHHREAAASFPCPCRLNGRVQGKKIRLFRYPVDHFQDLAYLVYGTAQARQPLSNHLEGLVNTLDGGNKDVQLFLAYTGQTGGLFAVGFNLPEFGIDFLQA